MEAPQSNSRKSDQEEKYPKLTENEIKFSGLVNAYYSASPEFAGTEGHYKLLKEMAGAAETLTQKISTYIPASELSHSFIDYSWNFPRYAVDQQISNQLFREIESMNCTYEEWNKALEMINDYFRLKSMREDLMGEREPGGGFPEKLSGIGNVTRIHNIDRLMELINKKIKELKPETE